MNDASRPGDRERRERWLRLSTLLGEVEGRALTRIPVDRISELGRLYQSVLADLAEAEGRGDDLPLVLRLNRLVGRAYAVIYRKPGRGLRDGLRFIRSGFPALVRARAHPILAALLVFLAAAAVGFLSARVDARLVDLVLPRELRSLMAGRLAAGDAQSPPILDPGFAVAFSSRLMTHNIEVGFIAFASGILAGLGTVVTLVVNGLLLGGFLQVFVAAGCGATFAALVLPHAVIELTAIFIAAGGGFILGFAIVSPGPYARGEWFLLEARAAVALLFGTLPLFVTAGLIEAYVTPSALPEPAKIGVAALAALALGAYLLIPGRTATDD